MRFTLWKIAEQDAGNAAQLARLLQVHEGAVHLPGFHAAVLEQQDCAVRVELPGSSQRSFDQRQAAAEKNAVRRARHHRLGSRKRDRPALLGFSESAREGFGVVAVSGSRAFVEARCRHWSVKADPAKFLPQKNLQRGEIAIAD